MNELALDIPCKETAKKLQRTALVELTTANYEAGLFGKLFYVQFFHLFDKGYKTFQDDLWSGVEPIPYQSMGINYDERKTFKPEKVKRYQQRVRKAITRQLPSCFQPFKTEVHVSKCWFHFIAPGTKNRKQIGMLYDSGVYTYKNSTPDVMDNLHKPLWDSFQGYKEDGKLLIEPLLYTNDSIIVSATNVRKIYYSKTGVLFNLIGK